MHGATILKCFSWKIDVKLSRNIQGKFYLRLGWWSHIPNPVLWIRADASDLDSVVLVEGHITIIP